MNLKGNLTSKGLQGSIGKSRMQGILGTNPAAIPISVDNALSLSSTNPVQNKVITQAITNRLWSDEVKTALLQIVEKVAYVDEHGQDYYDALYDALYPPTNLDSIGAVFDSSATIYNTDTLDDLKQYLTVTAYYTDGTSETVTTYTLSGSMDAGTQTITVAYGGKTTTFTVTVVEWLVSIDAVFTQGSATIYDTDSLDTLEQYLVVTATYADSTTATVSDYTLSGTLEAGTSTITASYGGKTDTFSVTVTTALVYRLTNHACDGTDDTIVDTNVALYEQDQDFTILLDVTTSKAQTTNWRVLGDTGAVGSSQSGILIARMSYSPYTNCNLRYMDEYYEASDCQFGTNYIVHAKFVIVHSAGSGEATFYWKVGNNEIGSHTNVATFNASNTHVILGGNQSGIRFFEGVISCDILKTALSSNQITSFLNGA